VSVPASRYAVVGPEIVVEDAILSQHALLINGAEIAAVLPHAQLPSDVPVQHVAGAYLIPGLVDIHIHGAAGIGYDQIEKDPVPHIGAHLLDNGITTVLPTLASAPVPHLTAALEHIAARASDAVQNHESPRIPGTHLEGPYFSPAQAGAQDLAALHEPTKGSVAEILEHRDAIAMMSFAPELPGAVGLTKRLVEAGIIAAAGHTDGTAADLAACQEVGLSHVIHIFSGQSTTRREGAWRVPGMLEATLASDDLTVEIIADGKHLPPELMKIADRALRGRLCAVSDATSGAGLPDGAQYQMGDLSYKVEDGVGMTLDGASFGGSTTLISQMLPLLHRVLGLSIPQAVAMVTAIPARAARLKKLGTLEAGKLADLCVLDANLEPLAVALGGEWLTPNMAPNNEKGAS